MSDEWGVEDDLNELFDETAEQPHKEEVMAIIPPKEGTKQFEPFIKLPKTIIKADGDVEKIEGEIKFGDKVLIKSEFDAPASAKIKSHCVGLVETPAGAIRTVGLNFGSYLNIAKSYGNDTKDWVGKFMKYDGYRKLSDKQPQPGHVWVISE